MLLYLSDVLLENMMIEMLKKQQTFLNELNEKYSEKKKVSEETKEAT